MLRNISATHWTEYTSNLQVVIIISEWVDRNLCESQTRRSGSLWFTPGVSSTAVAVGLGALFSGPSTSSLHQVTANTKTFFRFLHPKKLYMLSDKSKFDLVARSSSPSHPSCRGGEGNPKALVENTEWLEGTNSTGKDTRAIWTHRANVAAISFGNPHCAHTLKGQSHYFKRTK